MKKAVLLFLFLSAINLLITTGCGGRQKTPAVGRIQFSPETAGTIKAMTYNIKVDTILDGLNHWGRRRKFVVDIIRNNAADIIGTQEALTHQVLYIRRTLPQYTYYAAGRNDGKFKGETCAIFYRRDRFTLDDCGTFWFSDTPEKPGSKDWGNLWPRICSWAHLIENKTGIAFYVYNVHLDVLSQNSRQKSVELLAKRISMRKEPDPFIVMGDFNMEQDNPAMAYLENTDSATPYPKMVTAWESLYPGQSSRGSRHNMLGLPSGSKIDHIPVSTGTQVLDVQNDRRGADGRNPSDHYPVVAKILLTQQSTVLNPVASGTNPRQSR
jgi:endonuclease/exonuclease/phosphatase family metal-dependent hydrolase